MVCFVLNCRNVICIMGVGYMGHYTFVVMYHETGSNL